MRNPQPGARSALTPKKICVGEFLDRPVVRTWCFHCQNQNQSLVGGLRSCNPCSTAKKKERKLVWETIGKPAEYTSSWPCGDWSHVLLQQLSTLRASGAARFCQLPLTQLITHFYCQAPEPLPLFEKMPTVWALEEDLSPSSEAHSHNLTSPGSYIGREMDQSWKLTDTPSTLCPRGLALCQVETVLCWAQVGCRWIRDLVAAFLPHSYSGNNGQEPFNKMLFCFQLVRVGLWCFWLKIFLHALVYSLIHSLTKYPLVPWNPQAPE